MSTIIGRGTVGSLVWFWSKKSNHQKLVLVSRDLQRFVLYVTGLDFCKDRFDCQKHNLYKQRQYYKHSEALKDHLIARIYPKIPWHDVTAKLILHPTSVPIVKQLADNPFEQNHTTQLLHFSDLSEGKALLLRTIPDQVHSIHDCSCQFISNAQRYIYIENQYFVGDEQWIKNSIPHALANRVVNAINNHEPFTVVIIVPLVPNLKWGIVPNEVLYAQMKTMQLMARYIQQNTTTQFTAADMNNYFCFLTLEKEQQKFFDKSTRQRQFIYVHSKLMIIDNDIAVIGSANCNVRSMKEDYETSVAISGQSVVDLQKQLLLEHFGEDTQLDFEQRTPSAQEIFIEAAGIFAATSTGAVPYPIRFLMSGSTINVDFAYKDYNGRSPNAWRPYWFFPRVFNYLVQ